MAKRGTKRSKTGLVVSNSMDKTVVVAVRELVHHPLYKRVVRRTRKFKAHDAANECQVGDEVRIVETRPLSREKRWRVAQILVRAR